MNLLQSHIEQISLSSAAIADLPFTSPRPFTHALLRTTDITSLIRDTEAHERALFTLANNNNPPQQSQNHHQYQQTQTNGSSSASTRQQNRKSIYEAAGLTQAERTYGSSSIRARGAGGGLRANSAVARILGGDLVERIRRAEGSAAAADGSGSAARSGKSELDVGALLDGAERLCEVYPIAGAQARIVQCRGRYDVLAASIDRYEHIVEGQVRELEKLNRGRDGEGLGVSGNIGIQADGEAGFTRDDLRREEREIKELEERRKLLEQRVHGMERDLGGLMK